MAKRKASSSFACPGCHLKFDAETHAPFMGSCGHSLCGVCVNEKEIKDCPVCNKEGGFTWNQKNELAIELLVAKTEKKKPKFTLKFEVGEDTHSSAEQVPAILDPTNRAFLAQIVNQLDPQSFINLASSCKPLYNYCFNSREIKIVYSNLWLSMHIKNGVYRFNLATMSNDWEDDDGLDYKHLNYSGKKFGFLGSKNNRKKLQNYPFVFKLEVLSILNRFDEDFIKVLRPFLGEFPIDSITKVHAPNIEDLDGFLQLLKDFKIRDLDVYYSNSNYYDNDGSLPADNSEHFAAYILQNTDCLQSVSRIPDRLILNSSVKELILPVANISQVTFEDLLKRFSNSTEDIKWTLGCMNFEFGHHDLFPVLPFNYQGPLPEERPLVFVKDVNQDFVRDRFCVLRQDGKVLDCYKNSILMSFIFSTRTSYGFPPVFPTHYYERRQFHLPDLDDDFDEESDDFSDEESDD